MLHPSPRSPSDVVTRACAVGFGGGAARALVQRRAAVRRVVESRKVVMRMLRRAAAVGIPIAGVSAARRSAEAHREPHERAANAADIDCAMESMSAIGFAVCDGVVPRRALDAVRSTEAYRNMPIESSPLIMSTDEWRLSALGRYHRIDFSDEDVQSFEAIEALLLPYVARFFGLGIDLLRDGMARGSIGSRYILRSELQLLNAAPASHNQMWHSDHRQKGLTLVVPLVEFTADNGATQLIPGTHAPTTAWRRLLGIADGQPGAQVACAPAGALLAYDARTYHRGLGNGTAQSRPALVFRYDRADGCPPPGVGLAGSLFHATAATLLHSLGECARLCSRRGLPVQGGGAG